ncbi:hypothetical protein E1B28_010735 [Marasmius oreades]|uniref:Cyclopentanone 1,2-monooxygenase n=1 Tax=Marasmius oreades TaxID=181124 RepID=A0A9P7RSP3_9AGAR|nr:uncharacterized protein E1B28_010735 [Marasmius oreades]KAG7089024.1 hypothetical protein E1B28_010735 [Marasmius oreades]
MSTNASVQTDGKEVEVDVLVVGAGFGGVLMLQSFREAGFSVKLVEAGSDLGGIWYWNSYPGARVDSDLPVYQLTDERLWKDWSWKEKYPAAKEIREYFHYVDKKFDLSRDITYNTRVDAAQWDADAQRWIVRADDGSVYRPRWFMLCTGIGAKPYTPPFKGLDSFKGVVHHTAGWPEAGVDLKGKRVGVIGTGATGVQVIQEVGPVVDHLTVFQRTPNLALPMNQAKVDVKTQNGRKDFYPSYFRRRHETFGGFTYPMDMRETLSVPYDERVLYWEDCFTIGGFRFWVGNFIDLFTNQEANDEAYAFWRKKVRARVNDPVMQEKLAPTIPPHPFGCKRPSLEQNYYEIFNQPNVDLVDVTATPIEEITEKGIKTKDGKEYEFEILIVATGYDAVTGGITQIDIRGTDGVTIDDKWKEGIYTSLGMMTASFPNMIFMYGPQAPTAFCNGPSCNELQCKWIIDLVNYTREQGITSVVPSRQAEEDWRNLVHELSAKALWHKAKSWYMGANIPGKKIEPLNFTGGVPLYKQLIQEAADSGYPQLEKTKGNVK